MIEKIQHIEHYGMIINQSSLVDLKSRFLIKKKTPKNGPGIRERANARVSTYMLRENVLLKIGVGKIEWEATI